MIDSLFILSMIKIIFHVSLGIAILLIVKIIKILLTDIDRLTDYGHGYLVGKIILFLIFAGITYLTRKHTIKPKDQK